jgi:hypothetical protein
MKQEHKAAIDLLRFAGYQVIIWTPEEMEGMPDDAWRDMEDHLVEEGNVFIDTNRVQDEDDECPTCRGCGEGQYDGSSCRTCGGKGVIKQAVEWSE